MPPRKKKSDSDQATQKQETPLKCRRCAQMAMPQVHEVHGPTGDGCYDVTRCRSIRHHVKHREARNMKRRISSENKLDVVVGSTFLDERYFAILIRYQELAQDSPLHAIAVQLWKGTKLHAIVQHEIEQDDGTYQRYPALHCLGMTPMQIYTYVEQILATLSRQFDIKKFDSEERLDPVFCPIRPCPHHQEVG